MKKGYAFALILSLLAFVACKNPVEDFVLGFKEPIDTGTLRIQFNLPEEGKVPAGLRFSITGPDAEKMVTHLNTKKFRISGEGLMVLAIDPELTPTPQAPVDFTVVAEAQGYLKLIKSFRYASRANRTYSAQLVTADQKGALNTRQFELDQETAVEVVNGNEKLELQLPAANVYLNEQNEAVGGARDLALITYAAASALGRVPGGGTVSNPLDAQGKPLGNPFKIIRVAGMASIEMSTKSHEVIKSFKQPLHATMQLNESTIHPETGKALREGDTVDIISYDTDQGVWKLEGEALIRINSAGKPEVSFAVPHLSLWIAGWKETICATGPSFRVSSSYTNLDITYLARLQNTRDGSTVRDYYISLNNGARLNVSLMPEMDDPVELVVYDYNNYHGGDRNKVLARSAAVSVCQSGVIDLPAVKPTVPKPLTIEMDNSCPNGGTIPDAKLPAQMRIQFSEPGKSAWRDAGALTRNVRTSVTYRLIIGKRYDLRGSTDGGVSWPYTSKNAHVNQAYWYFELQDLGYCK